MKIIGYKTAHNMADFNMQVFNLPEPEISPNDVLVNVKAISINPVDYKIRQSRSKNNGTKDDRPVILGWDAAGVIEKMGADVKGYKVGDEIYYAGDLLRDGCYATQQAVDCRIIAKKPNNCSFAEAASLPLTAITAWEALLERGFTYSEQTKVLIIGGAGGVGSIATQLLKAKTPASVITTASRPETIAYCKQMGADDVINYQNDLSEELKKIDVATVDIVFGTTHSEQYLAKIPQLLRPFGHFCLIDDPKTLDIVAFKTKALSVHWEFMFAKTMHNYNIESQGAILHEIAQLVNTGKIKPTANTFLYGLTVENIKTGHALIESGKSIGKIVININ
jgi:NADPH:quinone reductase